MKLPNELIIHALEQLANTENITLDDEKVKAGIEFMHQGGDFADGVACQINALENASLLTFDKKAQRIAKELNISVTLPNL